MQVHLGVLRHTAEKVGDELGVEVSDFGGRDGRVPHEGDAPGQIEAAARQRLVHGHVVEPIAFDALFVAHGLQKGLAEADGDIFGAVVHVDVRVALALHAEAEAAVLAEEIQHVIEEAGARLDRAVEGLVQIELQIDPGFLGLA